MLSDIDSAYIAMKKLLQPSQAQNIPNRIWSKLHYGHENETDAKRHFL